MELTVYCLSFSDCDVVPVRQYDIFYDDSSRYTARWEAHVLYLDLCLVLYILRKFRTFPKRDSESVWSEIHADKLRSGFYFTGEIFAFYLLLYIYD